MLFLVCFVSLTEKTGSISIGIKPRSVVNTQGPPAPEALPCRTAPSWEGALEHPRGGQANIMPIEWTGRLRLREWEAKCRTSSLLPWPRGQVSFHLKTNRGREGGREGCFPGRDTWELLSQVPALRGGGGGRGDTGRVPTLGNHCPRCPLASCTNPLEPPRPCSRCPLPPRGVWTTTGRTRVTGAETLAKCLSLTSTPIMTCVNEVN